MPEEQKNVQHFLDLIKKSRRGKFKVYIGMSAGVGKTYRMLQEANALLKNGIDVKVGYIETHNRTETHALLEGLPIVPRRKLFYKGKELEELDVQAVINLRPEVVEKVRSFFQTGKHFTKTLVKNLLMTNISTPAHLPWDTMLQELVAVIKAHRIPITWLR